MGDVYVYDLNEPASLSDNDFVLVNIGTGLQKIKFSILKQAINNVLSQSDKEKIGAIIVDGDSTKFLDNSGNYRAIKQEDISDLALPIASQSILGGVKVDGTTITVAKDGTISGASTYELPVATNTTLGGVKIDNDTIKINEGVISADVIGNWSAGTIYPVGYFVVYEDKLYQCINANSDSVWTASNWSLVGSSGGSTTGTVINNWSASTDYTVGDLVINGTTLYQCNTEHTSGETFDDTEAVNWTALSGAKGDDGISPIASVEQTDTGCTITITDANGTTTVNLTNGTNGTNGNDGISPTATITQTEAGANISITDSTGTTSANIANGTDGNDGITPHIDETTKHWFIGETDTGIKAKGEDGAVEINTDCVILYATLLASGWSYTAPYTQTVTVTSISANNVPVIDISYSDDNTLWEAEETAYSCLTKVETADGSITATCLNTKPNTDFTIKLKVAGDISGINVVTQTEFDELKALVTSANTSLENTLNGGTV